MPSSRIAESLAELEQPLRPGARLDRGAGRAPRGTRRRSGRGRRGRARPIDVLLATSMLQVGVDVQRLGLMVVTGQPKNTAEYIQATSRSAARPSRPGLVVTIYQWSRPRDLAHYESFGYDHATFGLRVEGLTTTPFSDRALDRGLTGVLVTALRHSGMSSLPNVAAHSVPLSGPSVDRAARRGRPRGPRSSPMTASGPSSVRGALQHRLDSWYSAGGRPCRPGASATRRRGRHRAAARARRGSWDLWSAPHVHARGGGGDPAAARPGRPQRG